MAYREAGETKRPPVRVFHFRPRHPVAVLLVAVILSAFAAGSLYQGREKFRSVRIECKPGACEVVRDYVITTTREPMAPGTTAVLASTTSKGNSIYAVALFDGKERSLLTRWESKAEAEARRSVVDSARTRTEGTIEVERRDTALVVFHVLLALGIVSLSLLVTGSATFRFDPARQTIAVRVQQWPFRSARRTFQLDDVKQAVVSRSSGRNGSSYRLALNLHDETNYEVLEGSQSRCSEASSSINRLLAQMRESSPPT